MDLSHSYPNRKNRSEISPRATKSIAKIGQTSNRAFEITLYVQIVVYTGSRPLRVNLNYIFFSKKGNTIPFPLFVEFNAVAPETWAAFAELTLETSVAVTGEVRAEPRAPGGYELGLSGLGIIGRSPSDYPIQPKEHGVDFLLDHRHLWITMPR